MKSAAEYLLSFLANAGWQLMLIAAMAALADINDAKNGCSLSSFGLGHGGLVIAHTAAGNFSAPPSESRTADDHDTGDC